MIFRQEKYCEDCAAWYKYTTEGSPDIHEPCPVNPAHITRDCMITGTLEASEIFFPYPASSNSLNYGHYTLNTGNAIQLTIKIPCDFLELVEAEIHFISNVTGAGLSVGIGSTYSRQTEDYNKHAESDTIIKDFTTGKIEHIDLDTILTGISAGDLIGIGLNNNAGGDLLLLGIEFTYIRNTNSYTGS